MTGILFHYQPGQIDAQFSHANKYDDIKLDIRMDGDVTITTECDNDRNLAQPEAYQKEAVEFSVYMSSVFCPFEDLIRFLEAISLEVQECAFRWEGEGPDGEMRWNRRYLNDTGFLTVNWCSNTDEFSYRMMLNTRQTVGMLYTAFRSFIESDAYDPIRYEEIGFGDSFELVLSNATLADLSEALTQLKAEAAETVIQRLNDTVGNRYSECQKLSFPLDYFLKTDHMPKSNKEDAVIPAEWDSWDQEQQRGSINSIYDWKYTLGFGANLRQLRSTLVESWLAQPVPEHSFANS
jgi:hypothetical protein